MTIEFADLGSWGGATLISEYDPEDDAIRIDARAIARVRDRLGDAGAARFIACAIAHEAFHRAHPGAAECDASRRAAAIAGVDPHAFEAVLARGA